MLLDLKLEVAAFTIGVLVRLINVGGIVVDFNNSTLSELIPKCVERYEEDTVFSVPIEANTLLFLRINIVPSIIMVRPLALILSLAPRVTKLNESDLLSLEVEDTSVEKRVGMSLHHA